MISIITCSIKPDICQKMLNSVAQTIGTEYETLVFDNREKKNGICKAYNEAATEASIQGYQVAFINFERKMIFDCIVKEGSNVNGKVIPKPNPSINDNSLLRAIIKKVPFTRYIYYKYWKHYICFGKRRAVMEVIITKV